MDDLYNKAVHLLQELIRTPSVSRNEEKTSQIISNFLANEDVEGVKLIKNNLWVANKYFDPVKPTLLLNSHHDTVMPNAGYTQNPLDPIIKDEMLFGLGSNDAGGALVCLILTFVHFHNRQNLAFNLILLCSAEEEVSGSNGIQYAVKQIPPLDMAIVGEPTLMNMAIAEKGLMVLNCIARGKSGHAAREEGENAIYKALDDIEWVRSFQFSKISETLGPVKMSATIIEAGTQHNVVPDTCNFTLDIRTTDVYTNQEVLEIIQSNLKSEIGSSSLRLNSSAIARDHPLVKAGLELGMDTYGSPTLSDQSLLSIPSLKIGPGDSARSHTADEFIYLKEIRNGISTYINLLENLQLQLK